MTVIENFFAVDWKVEHQTILVREVHRQWLFLQDMRSQKILHSEYGLSMK